MERIDWFKGDKSALDLYERLSFVSHAIDDLIDRDKSVSVHRTVENLLLHIPGNAFYRAHEGEMRALMVTALTAYKAANIMQASGDDHKIELAHYARYVIADAVIFMVTVIHGMEDAPAVVAEIYPTLIPERLAEFVKEHDHGRG